MASGGKGQGGGFNGMGGGKMALSGRQMMLVKGDGSSQVSGGHSGTQDGRGLGTEGSGLGPGNASGPGLEPVGESQEYGTSIGHSDGQNHPTHHAHEGPVVGGAFSPSRGTSPAHNPSQPLRGQPIHPKFQGY